MESRLYRSSKDNAIHIASRIPPRHFEASRLWALPFLLVMLWVDCRRYVKIEDRSWKYWFLGMEGSCDLMEMHLRPIGNATGEPFGLQWGQFGTCLGSLWVHFGHMTVVLGHFEITWGSHSGPFGLTLGSAWAYEGDFRSLLDYFGITLGYLEHLFGTLGVTLGPHWDHFGHRRVTLDHFEVTLGSLWGHFWRMTVTLGSLRGHFGNCLCHLGVVLKWLAVTLGVWKRLWVTLKSLGDHLEVTVGIKWSVFENTHFPDGFKSFYEKSYMFSNSFRRSHHLKLTS